MKVGYPMQIMWFHKIATGLLKVMSNSGSSNPAKSSAEKMKETRAPKKKEAAAPAAADAPYPVNETNDKKVR